MSSLHFGQEPPQAHLRMMGILARGTGLGLALKGLGAFWWV